MYGEDVTVIIGGETGFVVALKILLEYVLLASGALFGVLVLMVVFFPE